MIFRQSHPIPPHPIRKLALRARRVNAELDPGGKGKNLVGKGLDTVRARLATVRARLAWGHLAGAKRPIAARVNHTPSPQLDIKFWKKSSIKTYCRWCFETPLMVIFSQKTAFLVS